jgi:hypothetical protein
VYKQHGNLEIRWLDFPGANTVPPIVRVTDDSRFLAYVLGTAGQPSCWCEFQYVHNWQAGRVPPVIGAPARLVDGVSCAVN